MCKKGVHKVTTYGICTNIIAFRNPFETLLLFCPFTKLTEEGQICTNEDPKN